DGARNEPAVFDDEQKQKEDRRAKRVADRREEVRIPLRDQEVQHGDQRSPRDRRQQQAQIRGDHPGSDPSSVAPHVAENTETVNKSRWTAQNASAWEKPLWVERPLWITRPSLSSGAGPSAS